MGGGGRKDEGGIVLYCIVLYCSILYCTILHCNTYCNILHCIIIYHSAGEAAAWGRREGGREGGTVTVLYSTVLYCTVLHCTVLYCTVFYCKLCEFSELHYTQFLMSASPMFAGNDGDWSEGGEGRENGHSVFLY